MTVVHGSLEKGIGSQWSFHNAEHTCIKWGGWVDPDWEADGPFGSALRVLVAHLKAPIPGMVCVLPSHLVGVTGLPTELEGILGFLLDILGH